jgi:hypothetical protein
VLAVAAYLLDARRAPDLRSPPNRNRANALSQLALDEYVFHYNNRVAWGARCLAQPEERCPERP